MSNLKDQNGVNINENQNAAFREACLNWHLEVVKYLYQNGADIKSICNENFKFIILNDDVVKYLIQFNDYLKGFYKHF